MQDEINLTEIKNDDLLNLILFTDTELLKHLTNTPKKQQELDTYSLLDYPHSELQDNQL